MCDNAVIKGKPQNITAEKNLFRARLHILDQNGKPISKRRYKIYLGKSTLEDWTDDNGYTKEIVTKFKRAIVSVDIFWEGVYLTRGAVKGWIRRNFIVEGYTEKAAHNDINITVAGQRRNLTAGEKDMVAWIFKDSIDTSNLWLHSSPLEGYFLGLTPNGHNVFFPHTTFSEDYSISQSALFIHEMAHVWQAQAMKVFVAFRGVYLQLRGGYDTTSLKAYNYYPPKQKFSDYNIEGQASIVEDYFKAKHLDNEEAKKNMTFYERTLVNFLRNPKDPISRPENWEVQ